MKLIFNSNGTRTTRLNFTEMPASKALFTMLSVCAVITTICMVNSAKAESTKDLIETFGCEALGGVATPQPAGSTITTCCVFDECFLCDENEEDCERARVKPDRFQKPTLIAPTDRAIVPVKPKRPTAKGTLKTIPRKLKLN